jgi:hypothetical protein
LSSELAEGSRVDAALIAAYRATHYCVNGASPPFLLRVDMPNTDLAEFHAANGVQCSAFLTAWNPASRPVPDEINQSAQRRLKAHLAGHGLPIVEGLGVDPTGQWAGEESVLVLGIDLETACAVGRAFQQHGIVWSGADAIPHLVMLE